MIGPRDIPFIAVAESPNSFSHEQISAASAGFAPDRVTEAGTRWGEAAAMLGALADDFSANVLAAVEGKWRGPAAERAASGIGRFAVSVTELANSFTLVKSALDEASAAAATFKKELPAVVVVSAASNERAAEKRNTSEEQARLVMQRNYIDAYLAVDRSIPVLPTAFDPVLGDGPSIAIATGTSSTGSGGGQESLGVPHAVNAAEPQAVPKALGAGDEGQAFGQSSGAAGAGGSGGSSPGQTPRTVLAASDPEPAARAEAGRGAEDRAAGTNRGGAGTSGQTSGPPIVGAQPVASPNAIAGGADRTTPAALRAGGTSATPVGGGMYPPGARTNGGEDDDHRIPSYLVTDDNAVELIGELPPYVPPVLGA